MTATVTGNPYISNTRKRASTDWIAVHCSATPPKTDIGASVLDKWHRDKGWACIGYHFVIKRDGTIEHGRDQEVIGAHVENYNSHSVGICMIGGVEAQEVNKPENNFTPEQFKSLELLLADLKKAYPKAVIQGHKDFPDVAKACPSFDVKEWVKHLPK